MYKRLEEYWNNIDIAKIEALLREYSALGPLPGILLPMVESFLPFLPLFVIVAGNASAYGFALGFFYSWIGTSLGSVIVFLLARKFGGKFSHFILKKYPATERFFGWIERRGFTPLFLLYCFPFTPSFFINIASGMSTVRWSTFLPALMSGKAVMVFMLSYIGHDWKGLIAQPWRIPVVALCFFFLWFIGKKVEKHYQLR